MTDTLPLAIRQLLMAAAAIKDPKARLLAIEHAIARAKHLYPQLFKQEHSNG